MLPYNNFQPQIFPQQIGQKVHTLYIGDLDEQIDDNFLYQFFSRYGQITHLKIQKDYETKRSKGFAFISYLQSSDAENARKEMNHQIILSKQIRVLNKKSPQELNSEANIVIKNLPQQITINELDQFFQKFGSIFSSRIIQKNQVAFIQYDNKESVQKCLNEQNQKPFVLYDEQIQIFQFQRSVDQRVQKTNIYLKNFPDITEQQIQKTLSDFCKKFGKVTSILVKTNKDIAKQFAFVCYENSEDAQNAYNQFKTEKLFQNECLYVNWAQTRQERNRKLKDTLSSIQNETNMFVKNLKSNVTKQDLENKFSIYGEISSCDVKSPQQSGQRQIIETKFGFINFINKEDAHKALLQAKKNESVQEIFQDRNVYINFHLLKSQSANFQIMKKNQAMQFIPNMNMIQPMQNFYQGNRQQGMQPIIKNMKNNFGPIPMGFQQQQMGFMNQQLNTQQFQQNMNFQQMNMMQQGQPIVKNKSGINNFQAQQQQMQQMQMQNMAMQNVPIQNMNSFQNAPNFQNVKNVQQLQNIQISQNMKNQQINEQSIKKKEFANFQDIKKKKDQFLKKEIDQQRTILGELLFPMIAEVVLSDKKDHVPKITGMLIDFSVFEVSDILELFEDRESFLDRVREAEELIQNSIK